MNCRRGKPPLPGPLLHRSSEGEGEEILGAGSQGVAWTIVGRPFGLWTGGALGALRLRFARVAGYFVSAMNPLDPPDVHHLRAAQGWLELGDDQEALSELEQVAPGLRNHPDVLELRWQVFAQARDWDASLGIAMEIVKQVPERLFGWLHRAYSMRRASGGGLKLALDALLPALERFPGEAIVPYNLACYTCQMGDLAEARSWLAKAFTAGETGELKRMALNDPDLKPLWKEIKK